MFQDEARFGRMVRIRRCWAQKPARPVVCNGYERQFLYVYGAVSPLQGQLDWMIAPQMNTDCVPGHRALQLQHLLSGAWAEGDAVSAGCGLQRPEHAGLVRIGVVVGHVGLALFFDEHPLCG